jgi:hypothetical protein
MSVTLKVKKGIVLFETPPVDNTACPLALMVWLGALEEEPLERTESDIATVILITTCFIPWAAENCRAFVAFKLLLKGPIES